MAMVIPADKILLASELIGAVKGIDPKTGRNYEDARRESNKLDTARLVALIVDDAGDFTDRAIIGELMSARAKLRGVAGIVMWGEFRDSAEPGAATYPVFASGVTHRGPYKNGPGEINVPIMMGGMPVYPGDIIVGDADGLVAVPQDQAERVLASAKSILEKETAAMKQILAGTVDRGW